MTLTNTPQAIEFVWRAGATGSFTLYVDGVQRAVNNNLNMSTAVYQLDSVRMGPSAGLMTAGTMYFDEFVSKASTTTIFGP